jgi:hypothetical protein
MSVKPARNQLSDLFQAIAEDDRAKAKDLLENDAFLAKCSLAGPARYERNIPHWIYTGDTALHVAAAGHRPAVTKMLLAAGADPLSERNHRLSQPLHYAADGYINSAAWNDKRQVAVIRILLEAGADIHARDKNGATPLHRAVRTRCARAVNYLLNAGADATARNSSGSTPFHLAVQNTGRGGSGAEIAKAAQRTIIEDFLKHGVSPTLKDGKGKSVLDWAKSDWIQKLLTGK